VEILFQGKGSKLGPPVLVSFPSEMREVLAWRDRDGDAEFTLGTSTSQYPYMILSVADERWYLHCFLDDDKAGFHSLGEDRQSEGETHMPAGCDIWVPKRALVDGTIALEAAIEFLQTEQLPTCLEWFEL